MLVSSADDARAPGASKLATLVNHSPARVEKRKGGGKKKGLCVTWFKDFWFLPLLLPILDPFSVVRLIRSHNVDEFFLIPILNNFKSFVKYVCLFVGKPSSFVLPVCYIGYIRKHGFIILYVTHVTFREFSASNNFILPPHEAKVSCGERSDKKRFASFIKGNSHTHTHTWDVKLSLGQFFSRHKSWTKISSTIVFIFFQTDFRASNNLT